MRFLEEANRLPGIRTVQRAMRSAVDPQAGMSLLDAGCGIGIETARLAMDHPTMRVTATRDGA